MIGSKVSSEESRPPGGDSFAAFLGAAATLLIGVVIFGVTSPYRERLSRDEFRREAAEVGVLVYECDPRTGAAKPYWIVPESAAKSRKVEAK